MLGAGIYFGKELRVSLDYTGILLISAIVSSAYLCILVCADVNVLGRRMLLVATVALGNVRDVDALQTHLVKAPVRDAAHVCECRPDILYLLQSGYHSVHGVGSTPGRQTPFRDDEWCVYDPAQVCVWGAEPRSESLTSCHPAQVRLEYVIEIEHEDDRDLARIIKRTGV